MNGCKFQIETVKKILEVESDGCAMNAFKCHRNLCLKMVKIVNFMIYIFYHKKKKR